MEKYPPEEKPIKKPKEPITQPSREKPTKVPKEKPIKSPKEPPTKPPIEKPSFPFSLIVDCLEEGFGMGDFS